MLITCAILDHPVGVNGACVLSTLLLMITGMTADFDIYLAYQRNVQDVSVNVFFVCFHK